MSGETDEQSVGGWAERTAAMSLRAAKQKIEPLTDEERAEWEGPKADVDAYLARLMAERIDVFTAALREQIATDIEAHTRRWIAEQGMSRRAIPTMRRAMHVARHGDVDCCCTPGTPSLCCQDRKHRGAANRARALARRDGATE